MSTQITIDLPDDAFSALRSSPENFVKEMRLAAAAKWYEIGLVSQSKAAELCGMLIGIRLCSAANFNKRQDRTPRAQLTTDAPLAPLLTTDYGFSTL